MFYSQFILAKKGPLGTIWIAAHLERKLRKNQVTDTDIGVSVDSIIFPEVPIALRLSSHLMVGVVRIYSRKVNYLFHDCSEALLKIKQAFRSTAVDLPPEESTAPYHSITLPETFHLDDFELPEAAFQGIIIQGRSSIHLTDMDVDDNQSKDEGAEGCNMDDEPSTHSKHITSWTGYNVQTPDLNMLLHNDDDAGPSTSYYQPSPYPFDEPASPEFVSAQAPATPGLMEETVPSRVHESPVLSPQRKASPSSNEEIAKADSFAAPPSEFLQSEAAKAGNFAAPPSEFLQSEAAKAGNFAAPPSEFLQSEAANANDAVGAETIDFGLAKPVQVESSGAVHEMDSPRQHSSTEDLLPVPQTSNLEATVDKLVRNTDDIAVSGETLTFKATMEGVPFVQNTSEPFANGSTEPSMIRNPTHFNEGSVDVQGYNMPTMGGVPFVQNTSEPCTNGSTEPRVTGNPTHFNEGSVNMQGYNTMISNYSTEQNSQRAPPEMAHNNISVADFQQNAGSIFQQNAGPIFHQNAGPIFHQNAGTVFQQNPATMFQQNSAAMFQQSPGTIFPQNAGTIFPQNAGTVFQQNAGTIFQQNAGTIFQQNAGQQNAGTIFQQNAGQQNAGTIFQQNAGQQNAGTIFQQNAGTIFQQNAGTIPQYMAYSDRPNDLSTSNFFPERETMLSAPDTRFHLTNDLGFGQITAEKGITESDGSNKIGSLTSRKRHLEDSLPAPESRTTVNLSSTPHGKRPADAVPEDDDLLASILGMCKDLNKLQYRTYDIVPHPTVHNIELQGQPDMPETIAVDTDNVSISGAKESATLDHQLNMVLPDGTQLDAMPQEATDAVDPMPQEATDPTPQEATDAVDGTAAFDLQMPSDDHVNNIEKVTESLFGDGKETPLVNETSFDANIPAQDDILDKDGRQGTSADLQRNTNADSPLFVLDDSTHDSATRVTDAPDVVLDSSSPARAQAVDDLNREQRDILHSDINVFEDKEMPTSVITGLEFTQNASAFPQPTEDENAVSAMGENSSLQENNAGSFVDMDNMGHDFALKECSVSHVIIGMLFKLQDFGSAIHDVDTDFLNYDDDGDFDEAAIDDEPNPDEFQSLDALSGWSSRTRGVARYLKTLFDEDSGLGRKNVAIDHLLRGKTRKEASRMFFETLVLSTKDYIQVEQPNPFDFVNVKPGLKLLKTDF
ncbi:hypothetical protein ACQ4PT_003878 [Festuca glaucescens]